MQKGYGKFIAVLLAVLMCLTAVGCGNQDKAVYLNYSIGMDEVADNYNNELYGLNGNDVSGADPGCFYVSEEEDPVNGGYFYMYTTSFATNSTEGGASLKDKYYKDNNITNLFPLCYRSKDLKQWEKCGALEGGFACVVDEEDWCQNLFWAPEVIRNPQDGKYYMYFNAMAPKSWAPGISDSDNNYDRLFLGVAVSETPYGPFDVLYDIDKTTGKRIPTINFQTGCNTQYAWSVIDASPFFDDNGDLYLYFNKHTDDHYTYLNGVWGMKMKSMTEPDYSTVSCLTIGGKTTASNEPGVLEKVTEGEDFYTNESSINEGPYMLKHEGKYYLTYSRNGFADQAYSVMQAVSDKPLSGFEKLGIEEGNPVLDGSIHGVMTGTGHHAFAKKGDQLYVIYHRHASAYGWDKGDARVISSDRVQFVKNEDGLDVLSANGPLLGLSWLEEDISGYKNLAKDAKVEVSSGEGAEYLNDGILPFYDVTSKRVLKTDDEKVQITLSWEKPVSVSSVMVYNSSELETAFSAVSELRFRFAEKPSWAKDDYTVGVIQDLKYPEKYYNTEKQEFVPCAPAVAEFDSIKITELTITLDATDKYVSENKFGEKSYELKLSEIVILGGVE